MRKSVCMTLLSGLLVLGCSSSTMGSGDQSSSAEMNEIKRRVMELQENATVAQVEVERLRQQVANLEAALRELGQQRAGGVEISETVSPYGSIIAVEETDLPPVQVPQPAAGAELGGEDSTFQESSSDPVVGFRPVEPAAQALYDRGYSLFHQGRYLDAEATFQRFLQAYSDTDLSDNAQYWIGECRYARQDLRGALAAFRETAQRYPAGNKVPDAMIKEGDCLRGLGDLEGARLRYDEVINRYPGSAAASVAEERRRGT